MVPEFAHFERGSEYFFLTTEKSTEPSKATEIRHPAPSISIDKTCLSSDSALRRRPGPSSSPEKKCPLVDADLSTAASQHHRSQAVPKTQKVLRTYVSQKSLEKSLSDMSVLTETDAEEPSQHRHRNRKLDSERVPLNVKIIPGESPYNRPQQTFLYGGKPPQTWFYDQQGLPISQPPKVAKGVFVPFKSLYICDTVNGGRCLNRQVWINESKQGVEWLSVNETTQAKQVIDGEIYVCYVGDKGPRWVKRASYVTYKGRK